MSTAVNTKIQPLIEDVGRIVPGVFLKSTEYKRWLVERDLDNVWSQIYSQVESNRNFFAMGFDHEAADSKDALNNLLNIIFEQRKDWLPAFLVDLLSFYAYQETAYIDVTDIKKDLLAAGYTEEEAAVLEGISIPEQIEEKLEEEQTEEQKVRSLEQAYLAHREENSHEAIDAYLKWHSAALLYLSNYYTEANPDYSEFKHIDNSGNGHVLRHNYKSLHSIYNLLMNNVTTQEIAKTTTNDKKTPLVFISHSSKDKDFANALVALLEDIGFDSSNLFCSSVEGYGIALSKDIFETLRSLFNEHSLYVIFIHSPRYYKSAVSLNEMGAAWVLKTDFCSFLTTDMAFNKMEGVVNGSTISIKVDAEDAPARLTELKDNLIQTFGLQSIDGTKWERKRKVFLDQVLSIEYKDASVSQEKNESTVEFDADELDIFSKWANNPTDSTFMAMWSRKGLEVHFGYHNGYTFPRGEALAQYEDLMNRLQQAGFITADGTSNNVTKYKITKQGYDYAKTLIQ